MSSSNRLETLAAVLPAAGGAVEVQPIALGGPGAGEVLVRMEACGICHSDVLVAGMATLPLAPVVLGHEGVGRVEAVGEGVAEVRAGDRVGITFLASSCGSCELCRSGRERFCARQINAGYTRHGALAQYAVTPVQHLARVPEELDALIAAPLCCAGWTALSAIRQAALQPGQMVALFGMGGLGHLAIQYARHCGVRVAAVDVSESKLELARQLGAEVALRAENAGRVLIKEHGGADAAIVFTASPAAVPQAFKALKRNGTLVLVGLATTTTDLPIFDTILKGITIKGSFLGSRAELEEVFHLALRGVGLPQIEAHSLAEAPEVLDRLRRGELLGRAVVRF